MRTFFLAVAGFALLAGCAGSSPYGDDTTGNPYTKANDSWVSLTGTVANSGAERFLLDYGSGAITVEMDDWDSYDDTARLRDGERVTVYGFIDSDFYQSRSIEAQSVYVFERNTYYFASGDDEEDLWYTYHGGYFMDVPEGSWVTVAGTVTDVSGGEFKVKTAGGDIMVDVDRMSYNPLDEDGYQRIDVGDRVTVTGTIDDEFFEGKEIKARTITTMAMANWGDPQRGSLSDSRRP
jgi:uncharacterized protein YdeI (BOF family)